MNWFTRYCIRHYIVNSIWVYPFLCMFLALAMIRVIHWIDSSIGWEAKMNPETARAVLATLASAMFTFVGFVSSALLVAVQLATAQLTPRIIAIVFRSPITRSSLSLFIFTFTFCAAALMRITDTVPALTAQVAAYACVFCLAEFLYLIDHVGKSLRPSGALRSVAEFGRAVVKNVYPHRIDKGTSGMAALGQFNSEHPTLKIENPKDEVVLAFDVRGLVSLAEKTNCIIELVPQVGDHIAASDPLLRVFGPDGSIAPAVLRQSVVVGMERTLEQDPTFAFRIMVDIASKGLSPAINDPTTAVLAIDQIHHHLRYVGGRNLDSGLVCDQAGKLRLVYRTPDWEDFVRLAVTEIRHFGGESIQVARRLRAMLENLVQNLPESRGELLRQELALLHRSAQRFFSEPEDLALAEISDAQGVGGKRLRK